MSWIGGKKALRDVILQRFPLYYEKYIEVFGGGGWVLFHKPPGNDFEVYNDFNGLLANLYRCVRNHPRELTEALKYTLNSREDFELVRAALARNSPATDIQRAAWFYQIIRYSYATGLTSYGSRSHDNGISLRAYQGGYKCINPPQAIPQVISTNGTNNIDALKKYFCSEFLLRLFILQAKGLKCENYPFRPKLLGI